MINHELSCRGQKIEVGLELQAHLVAFYAVILKDESVGNGLEKLAGPLFILLHTALALGAFLRIIHQSLHALLVFIPLLGRERPAIDQERLGKGAVLVFGVELILNGFTDKLVGFFRERGFCLG